MDSESCRGQRIAPDDVPTRPHAGRFEGFPTTMQSGDCVGMVCSGGALKLLRPHSGWLSLQSLPDGFHMRHQRLESGVATQVGQVRVAC